MNVGKKWVAAGSTATLLAGGLFLGAPAATAAPGDQACLAASTQFNAALGAAGIDLAFVNQLEAAVANVVVATENLLAVSVELNVDGLLQASLDANEAAAEAQLVTEQAKAAVQVAIAASTTVDEAGNPAPELDQAVIDARAAEALASQAETEAVALALVAVDAYLAVLENPAVVEVEAAFEDAALKADELVAQLGGDEALAAQIVELFKAFLAACDASAIGVDPVVPIVTPVTPAPVVVTPAPEVVVVTPAPEVTVVTPAPVAVAPATGTNKGLNVQTAVATEDNSAAMTLIAALLAVGVAVPMATAARMRRLERAQR